MVAFPPPPVTSPATRLSSCDVSGFAPIGLIISRGRCFVFIRATRSALRLISASLSASAPDVPDSGFPLLLSSNDASPHPFHLPVPVKMPVSNLDCEMYSTDIISLVNRKNAFHAHFYWVSCGKGCGKAVNILWISCEKPGKFFAVNFLKKSFVPVEKNKKS